MPVLADPAPHVLRLDDHGLVAVELSPTHQAVGKLAEDDTPGCLALDRDRVRHHDEQVVAGRHPSRLTPQDPVAKRAKRTQAVQQPVKGRHLPVGRPELDPRQADVQHPLVPRRVSRHRPEQLDPMLWKRPVEGRGGADQVLLPPTVSGSKVRRIEAYAERASHSDRGYSQRST